MIKTEHIFSDGMVLQRELPVPVWGECDGISEIQVSIGDIHAKAEVAEGRFRAVLPALGANTGLTLEISGVTCSGEKERLVFQDVAVGEVWIAAGQSNMEFPLKYDMEADTLLKLPKDEELRFFDVPKVCYDGQEKEEGFVDLSYWRHFSREDAGMFSAAATYFGLKLRKELKVPVGIVGCNWGATSASCWMGEEYLREHPELTYYLEAYEEAVKGLDFDWYREAYFERLHFGCTPRMKEIDEALNRGTLDYEEIQKMIANATPRQRELLSLPVGPLDHIRPCVLFEWMVKRIAGYGARGVLWYQGESDGVKKESYALLFAQLVKCWRESWGRKLPFLCVQLAPFGRWLSETGEAFPELRRQQQRAADLLEEVYLASIMDNGMENDIHPKSKRAAGERLALLALGKVYGQDILCEAPRMADVQWESNRITIYMAHAGEGLACRPERQSSPENQSSPDKQGGPDSPAENPEGLILWENGVQKEFTAEVGGCRIVIHCVGLKKDARVQVSYAQQPYVKADIYNSAGLCVKPFSAVR